MRRATLLTLLLVAAPVVAGELLPTTAFLPPPTALTLEGQRVTFHADGTRYESFDAGANWAVEADRETIVRASLFQARRIYTDTTGTETVFQSVLDRDAARLLIRRFEYGKIIPVADVVLYDRWDVRKAMGRLRGRKFLLTSEDTLASAPKPGPALFSEVRRAGNSLWMGVGWQVGSARGVGAIVRHELDTGETRVFRPIALENWSVARLALTPNTVWLAGANTIDDLFACRTLARFDPRQEDVEFVTLELESPRDEVRALEAAGDTVWLATERRISRVVGKDAVWSNWRIRATVRVSRREEISNLPGLPSRRALPSGTYFVLGMTADSLLVRTADGVEGWMAPDTLRGDVIRLREEADSTSRVLGLFPAGLAIEPLPLRTPDGWRKARARVGWLARSDRQPRPVLEAVEAESVR